MTTVRQVIEGLTGASLGSHTEPVEGPGWPHPRSYPVRECLLIVLNEEWEHRLYAERDLGALEPRGVMGRLSPRKPTVRFVPCRPLTVTETLVLINF
jgi:hypothetical protein